jgi:hypothetical protein
MRRLPNLPGATADSELDYLLGLPVLPLPHESDNWRNA